jgi:hypothetical protein
MKKVIGEMCLEGVFCIHTGSAQAKRRFVMTNAKLLTLHDHLLKTV